MTTTFTFNIPCLGGSKFQMTVETGHSIIIIGANGSGKTRLGVYLEENIQPLTAVQRIPAQKSLSMNADLTIISLERAEKSLRFGRPDGEVHGRSGNRWRSKPATHLVTDFDA